MREVYLDYAAATPVDARVASAMEPYLAKEYGNPSSAHRKGIAAKRAIEESRKTIADILGCRPQEIIFTGGGTEAINLAIQGIARAHRAWGKHLITTRIEHAAVLRTMEALAKEGFSVTYLGVGADGLVDAGVVARAIRPDTTLVSVMYANNEIGVIEPIASIGKAIKEIQRARKQENNATPLWFFTDACQAAGALDLDVDELAVDAMAMSGSKVYGPKGVGCLYARSGVALDALVFGGGQERGLRSGTENVYAMVGLAAALGIVEQGRVTECARLIKLRDYFIAEIQKRIPDAALNGHAIQRLPNNINISIPYLEGEVAVIFLDAQGVYASTGSACSSSSQAPSHVIAALGRAPQYAQGSLRFTLGRVTTRQEITRVLDILPDIVARLRSVSERADLRAHVARKTSQSIFTLENKKRTPVRGAQGVRRDHDRMQRATG